MKTEINNRIVNLPDFLIVGAGKSGTTSLFHYLKQHPQIFMPEIKEPNFFAFTENPKSYINYVKATVQHIDQRMLKIATELNEYADLFNNTKCPEDCLLGEASPTYLVYSEAAIRNIKKYIPDCRSLKIIIILRDPRERLFSAFSMMKQMGLKYHSIQFEEFLETTDFRDSLSCYERVKAYMDNFPLTRVYLFENLKEDAAGLARDIFGFLEVDDSFAPDVKVRYNPSGVLFSRLFHQLLSTPRAISSWFPLIKLIPLEKRAMLTEKLMRKNIKRRAEMKNETRRYLTDIFSEDILKLQGLIGRDLSGWLEN
jgi:hypothetical protein